MFRKRIMPVITIVMVALLIPVGIWFGQRCRVISLLKNVARQPQMVASLQVHTSQWESEFRLSWDTLGDERYYTLDTGAESLYFHEDDICFESGTGYDLSGMLADWNLSAWTDWKMLLFLDVKTEDGIWSLSIPDLLINQYPEYRESLDSLNVTLHEKDGTLEAATISHENMVIEFQRQDQNPKPIPTELLMVLKSGQFPDIRTMKPLIFACNHLAEADSITAEAVIRVNCGPMSVEETGKFRLDSDGLAFGRSDRWITLLPDSVERENLALGLGWMLLRDGQWLQEEGGGQLILPLPPEQVKSGILSIIPELEGLDFRLEDGILTVEIRNGAFDRILVTCAGELPFLITTIPLSIQVKIHINR